jgi:hypothetical protein
MRNKMLPIAIRETSHRVDGLTLTVVENKSYTFTLKQLKFAVTTNKLFNFPVPREYALDVLCKLIRKHRYDIWGTFDGYKVITNGYGQLKEIQTSHSNPMDVDRLFELLEKYA